MQSLYFYFKLHVYSYYTSNLFIPYLVADDQFAESSSYAESLLLLVAVAPVVFPRRLARSHLLAVVVRVEKQLSSVSGPESPFLTPLLCCARVPVTDPEWKIKYKEERKMTYVRRYFLSFHHMVLIGFREMKV
jgi:hypothetical protein